MVRALAFLTIGLSAATAWGQASDQALKDRVAQLAERLGGTDTKAADEAEAALIKLGARALPLLPPVGGVEGEAANARLEKVRTTLRDAADQVSLDASNVTIQGQGIRLSEVLRDVQKQTANRLSDLRDEPDNPSLDLDLKDVPFLKALDEICKKAGLTPSSYTGDGTIGLQPGAMMAAPTPDAAPTAANAFVQYTGPFRVELLRMTTLKDFRGGSTVTNAFLEVAWEPRLRPMLLKLNVQEIEAVDDQGRAIKPRVMNEMLEAGLQTSTPVVEINIDLETPNRDAKLIAKLKAKGELTLPSNMRSFRFPNLAKADQKVSQGDVSVTLLSAEAEDQIWKVQVEIARANAAPDASLESYQQGMVNNVLYLQRKDGSRFEHNGGFSPLGSGDGKMSIEYLFVEAPGKMEDYAFIYETPSQIKTIPLEFEFKDIPLP